MAKDGDEKKECERCAWCLFQFALRHDFWLSCGFLFLAVLAVLVLVVLLVVLGSYRSFVCYRYSKLSLMTEELWLWPDCGWRLEREKERDFARAIQINHDGTLYKASVQSMSHDGDERWQNGVASWLIICQTIGNNISKFWGKLIFLCFDWLG